MALVHRATVDPSKQQLVEAWLPTRPWAQGLALTKKLAEYRFDDPAGEVGVETIVFAAGDDAMVQVPLTYRATPLADGGDFLVGTCEHSVLGPRWVYDGCGDPVWVATLAAAILTGGTQAQMYLEEDGRRIDIPPRMTVQGSGSPGAEIPAISAVESARDDGATTVVRAGCCRAGGGAAGRCADRGRRDTDRGVRLRERRAGRAPSYVVSIGRRSLERFPPVDLPRIYLEEADAAQRPFEGDGPRGVAVAGDLLGPLSDEHVEETERRWAVRVGHEPSAAETTSRAASCTSARWSGPRNDSA